MKINKLKLRRRHSRTLAIMLILVVFVSTFFFYFYHAPKAHAQIFLTSGTTWTVPADWSNSNNTIEVIGGGGGGGGGFSDNSGSGGEGAGAGGAGAYSKAVNVTLSPSSTVAIAVGTGGSGGASGAAGVVGTAGTAGSDTYLCNATTNCASISGTAVLVGAKGGGGGAAGASGVPGVGGTGGASASGIGSTKVNGGTGGTGGPTSGGAGGGGGGGGGAGGLNAAGNNGTTATNTTGQAGGQGDGTSGGSGGGTNGGTGGNGTEYDATHGSGGGGGGGNGIASGSGNPGGNGGNYGGGGGGGGGNGSKHGTGGAGANGIQGLIRINYTFTTQNDYRWRLDDGNETTGTSLAAQDTAASINYGNGTNVRLRVSLTNTGSSTTFSYRLEYAVYDGACGSWTAIPATATTEEFNIYTSSNITDQAATTNAASGPGVITDPAGYTFTAGKFVDNTSNTATNQTIGAGNFTELEYAIAPNANANHEHYCFRVTTSAGTPMDAYNNYPVLDINYPPTTPVIYSVLNGTTNVPRLPIYQLRSADLNLDYLRYVVETCPTNSWPCGSGGHTYNESNACWSAFDSQSGTAFSSRRTESTSTMAYCQTPSSDILTPNTTYYMRAKAIDPGGTNSYSAYSSVVSFTTGTLDIQINGGTCIGGTGSSCASGSGASVTGVKIGG